MSRLAARLQIRRIDPRLIDAGLALAAITVSQLDIWLHLDEGSSGGSVQEHQVLIAALSLGAMSMLLLRRRAPLTGLAVMAALLVLQVQIEPVAFFLGGFVPVMFMAYAVGAYAKSQREAVAGLMVAVIGVLLITRSVPELRGWDDIAFDLVTLGMAWTVGGVVGARGRRAEELEIRTRELEMERARTISEERSRLARELHDIVAHSVSIIAIQAEAGEALLDEPERAARSFHSIQATSRQALTELRRLLDLLQEPDATTSLAPQPSLAGIGELVESVREAGLETELSIDGVAAGVDPGVDLSAYRLVQEALTNSLKHAGARHASVRIRYLEQAIELDVTDDGGGVNGGGVNGNGAGAGRGLIGMRERVALYGGEIFAGTPPEGGFAVHARLPLRLP